MSLYKIRVLIVDDHAIVRAGLRLLISGQEDMTVVGEAGSTQDGIDAAERLFRPSFSLRRARWVSTVLTLMPSCSAISEWVWPWASSTSTWRSRALRRASAASAASEICGSDDAASCASASASIGETNDLPSLTARMAASSSESAARFTTYPEPPAERTERR